MIAVPPAICVVLVAAKPPPYGGLARWTETVLHGAAHTGKVELHVIDTSPRWRSVEELRSWRRFVLGSVQALRDSIKLLSFCFRFQPDIIHVATPGSFALFRDAVMLSTAWLLRLPSVLHVHFGRLPSLKAGKSFEWLLFTVVARIARHVVVLDAASHVAIKATALNVGVSSVPNGISTLNRRACRRLDDGNAATRTKSILYLGWVIPSKGIDELVAAWNLVSRADWSLDIVGPGSEDYKAELRAKFTGTNLRIRGAVAFHDAEELMEKCDIFVLPSHTEGFPYSVLEAMAAKKPIIATRVGAIPEMLASEGKLCGLLTTPRGHLELAASCSMLMADEALRHELGENAFTRVVGRYSSEVIFERLAAIWTTLMEQRIT